MKAQFKVSSKLIIDVEADTQQGLFDVLAEVQDVFGQDVCQKCKQSNTKFVVRTDKDGNNYYSMDCQSCGARLSFGCHKEAVKKGGLFIKRKDKDDNWLKDGGWQKWNKATQSLE